MARKKALSEVSDAELLKEMARRHAEKNFREGMTMTEIELSVESMVRGHGEPSVSAQPDDRLTLPLCERWRRDLDGAPGYPLVSGGLVYVATSGNVGKQLWALDQYTVLQDPQAPAAPPPDAPAKKDRATKPPRPRLDWAALHHNAASAPTSCAAPAAAVAPSEGCAPRASRPKPG